MLTAIDHHHSQSMYACSFGSSCDQHQVDFTPSDQNQPHPHIILPLFPFLPSAGHVDYLELHSAHGSGAEVLNLGSLTCSTNNVCVSQAKKDDVSL